MTPLLATYTAAHGIALAPFSSFVDLLTEIEDPRRAEGKLYRLPHVVLFAILAIVAGANSYRTIHSFIDVHLARLRDAFGVKWRKAPAYTTIRGILRQLDPASVEAAFRRHAAVLNDATNGEGQRHVAIDGKTLRGSFDNFLDRRAAHILSAFASDTALVLAHLDCNEKSNEIPAVQTLLGTLALTGSVVTVDAMHCQKKHPPVEYCRGTRPSQAAKCRALLNMPISPTVAAISDAVMGPIPGIVARRRAVSSCRA